MDMVNTVLKAVCTALTIRASNNVTDAVADLVTDGYRALKDAVVSHFGERSNVVNAVNELELHPESRGRQTTLKEELEAADLHDAQDVLDKAVALLTKLEQDPTTKKFVSQHAHGRYIAQASDGSNAQVIIKTGKSDK